MSDFAHDDPIFEEEQQHLTETYGKLLQIERELSEQLEESLAEARRDKQNLLDDLAVDFGNGVNLETYVEFEAMHQVIDQYNQTNDIRARRLADARTLLRRPYFAKLSLQFKPDQPARDIYLGVTGMADEMRKHFVIDWRSPVAEVYYNQSNGPTSYDAHGRTIHVNLKLRRQFEIVQDQLQSYFDTTVAIQDPLLLQSLRRERSNRLQDITATIQREQNQVIRHEDVPALLVSGIAGSGKTSVLLQRIAYLFYRLRDNLDPRDVYLVSPNDVFARYIEDVLPNMGERNPITITWNSFVEKLGLGDRGLGKDCSGESLKRIDQQIPSFRFDPQDFCDIRIEEERILSAAQIRSVVQKHAGRIPAGPRLAALVEEDLLEKIHQRARRLAADEEVQEAVLDLDTEDLYRIFGGPIQPDCDQDFRNCALRYLEYRYRQAIADVCDGAWLRIDRIGMRMLGKESLTSAEYLYLKMSLTGAGNREARFVMIDEVQDYQPSQLMVLARYFKNAHFLLLGDENQAIRAGTASFADIREIFKLHRGGISECRLATSYRSSPEITALFTSLMDRDEGVEVSSVQEAGVQPTVQVCTSDDEYLDALRSVVQAGKSQPGLTAIVAANPAQVKKLSKLLADDAPAQLDPSTNLPASGVVIVSLAMAKGLEFDRVIIPDAQASIYDGSTLSRHRLYTAISRATHQVTILANGTLTPLL